MDILTKTAAEVYAPTTAEGAPRGSNMGEMLLYHTELEMLIGDVIETTRVFASSKAELLLKLNYAEGERAEVRGDADPANNGVYKKVGAANAGTWVRVSDLPDDFVRLIVTGGTANAIEVTASPQTPVQSDGKVFLLTVAQTNTGAVTIKNGAAAPVPLKTLIGGELPSGTLLPGVPLAAVWSVNHLRLWMAPQIVFDAGSAAEVLAARDLVLAALAATGDILPTTIALNGADLSYPLGYSPISAAALFVTINAVPQRIGSYNVFGSTITFPAGTPSGIAEIRDIGAPKALNAPAAESVGAVEIKTSDVAAIRTKLGSGAVGDAVFQAATEAAARAAIGAVNVAGDTMTGPLVLSGDPTDPLGAATKQFAEGLVVGLLDDRGDYDASTNLFPAAGGSGTAGAVKKGDTWRISVAGTLGGDAASMNDWVRALTDAPGQTAGNWVLSESNLGFTPENVANKSTDVELGDSTTVYPVQNAVKVYVSTRTARRPGGRLTLAPGVPVMVADATAQVTIYYTPAVDALVPIYNGTRFLVFPFSELSLALASSANWASGSIYDLFVFNDAGTLRLGTGPAWTSSTARGTGAGTTELQHVAGIWTNKVSMTARYGAASTVAVAANQGTYVGSFYATANGQTGMAFKPAAAAGGTNNFLALFNSYNRVPCTAYSRDNTASWTYDSATVHAANASNSNRITFLDGLAAMPTEAMYQDYVGANASNTAALGVAYDATNVIGDIAGLSAGVSANMIGRSSSLPLLGLHYVQATEASLNALVQTFYGAVAGKQAQGLSLRLEF